MLPNRSRTDWVAVETGFQSAKTRSGVGKFCVGTKVLAMKVSGKITMNEALLTTSGVRTSSPTGAISHEIANANASSTSTPSRNSQGVVCGRQPTARPVSSMTTIETMLSSWSATVRPISTAPLRIGSERNRSISPFCRSSARAPPVTVAPKITVWQRMPGRRNEA